jgi:phosphatidate cytidylyltransferase
MNNLAKRALTGVIAGFTAIFFIVISPYGLAGLCILASLFGLWEYMKLSGISKIEHQLLAMSLVIVAWACTLLNIPFAHFGALLLPIMGIVLLREKDISLSFPTLTRWIFGLMYCALPFLLLYNIAFRSDGTYIWQFPLYAMIINYISDTMAFFTGKWFGKHSLSPTISPKKSWEGAIGGFVFAWITGIIVHVFVADIGINWLWITAIISVFNQPGDLIESMIKRSVNAKDSGTILPGHGGVLDRVDSFLTIFPILYVYMKVVA